MNILKTTHNYPSVTTQFKLLDEKLMIMMLV